MRVSDAWELLGWGNGAASLEELRTQIGRYRKAPIMSGEDPEIGCLLLRDPRFFPETTIAAPPPDFAPNIVQGKGYNLAEGSSAPYFGDLIDLLVGAPVEIDLTAPWHRPGPVFGDPRLAPYRLGQQAFKPWFSTPTTGSARSLERTFRLFSRQRTCAPSLWAASTGSTMACCSDPMCIPCSTAVT
jgi:hypothetical protein